jgi:hypothetical protein
MPVDHESVLRVLRSIKDTARGFKGDKLKARLMPMMEPKADDVANPLDAKPDEEMAESAGMGDDSALGESSPESPEKEKKEDTTIEEIRRLLARV